jgi:hypothetical protein
MIMAAIDQVLARRGGVMSRSPSIASDGSRRIARQTLFVDGEMISCHGPGMTVVGVDAEADENAS